MKFILIISGIICFLVAIGFAGNFIYNPFSIAQSTDGCCECSFTKFTPEPKYPQNDPADKFSVSEPIYLNSNHVYVEYSFIWLLENEHNPDTERVRIYLSCDNNQAELEKLSLYTHYEWIDVTGYEINGTHPIIYFAPVYHTPYISEESFFAVSTERMSAIIGFSIFGLVLIIAGVKL